MSEAKKKLGRPRIYTLEERKERQRAAARAWQRANPDKVRAKNRAYQKKVRAGYKAAQKAGLIE